MTTEANTYMKEYAERIIRSAAENITTVPTNES